MERLRARTRELRFGAPVAYVYNPLEYAWDIAKAYAEKYGRAPKEVLFLGMNPGPFGMAQTGVPFGEVSAVREYLKLGGAVASPARTHPKRPVQGFDCKRSEVSGKRLWGAFARRTPDAAAFFARAYVFNYCPLLFLGDSGANLTPDKLKRDERDRLEAVCDEALAASVDVLRPRRIVGVGVYAAKRAALVTGRDDVVTLPHPSPASPLANRGWDEAARKVLEDAGLAGLV